MIRIAVALAIAAGMAASAQAVVLASWENATEGWGGTTGFSNSTGVTHGTYSAMHDPVAGFGWGLQTGNWNAGLWVPMEAALLTNSHLSFDVTATNEDSLGDTLTVGLWLWHSGGNGSAGSASVKTDGSTKTLSFDVSGFTGLTQIRLWTNVSGGNGFDPSTIYYDKFRAVPEPAALGLMGLGALMMFSRRR